MTTSSQSGVIGAERRPLTGATPAVSVIDERLVEHARELAPLVRQHADQAERERRLAKPVVDALLESGLELMFTPRALGGLETDPVTCARVVEEIAGADSAAAWALQVGNTGAWWCAHLPPEGVDEIYADGPRVLISASFQPPHHAVEVPGGYRFTGRGPLASTIHDSRWVVMTALVMDGERPRMTDGMPEMMALVLPIAEVEIVDTWDSLGMRGTDSNDVEAIDLFVPRSRTFRVVPQFTPGPRYEGPLYRFPAAGATIVIVAHVALAIARGAIDELRELAVRKTPVGSTKTLRDRSLVQATLGEAEGILRAARLLLYDTLARLWQRTLAGETVSLEQRADLMLAGAHAAKSATRVTEMMHRLAGTTGIYTRNRLERHFRDAHTVRQHAFVSESRFETAGQVYLGVPPEFGFVAF